MCEERELLMTDKFAQKVIQMYEMMLVRHGFMLVGRPMGGKSTVIQVNKFPNRSNVEKFYPSLLCV